MVIQMQNIHPAFLFRPYFVQLFLLCLYYSSPRLCGQIFAPGVLVKEFLGSPALLKLFSQPSPGPLLFNLPHIVLFLFLLLDTASALCSPLEFLATTHSLLPAREGS